MMPTSIESTIIKERDETSARISLHQVRRPSLYHPEWVRLAPARTVSISEWEASK